MSLDLTKDKSTLVQVMAWCRQATSHYLSQCWPRSLSPYGLTRPQWANSSAPGCDFKNVVFIDWYLQIFLWLWPQMIAMEPFWWWVKIWRPWFDNDFKNFPNYCYWRHVWSLINTEQFIKGQQNYAIILSMQYTMLTNTTFILLMEMACKTTWCLSLVIKWSKYRSMFLKVAKVISFLRQVPSVIVLVVSNKH